MDTTRYLQRIGYDGPLTPDAATLTGLHRSHLLAVPFENLDIHWGNPILLDLDRIYDKVVGQGRGGFCYELNGLFGALLRELGFSVEMVSARVHKDGDSYGPEFDHMALLVEVDHEMWLADVGFGKFVLEPLRFVADSIQEDPHGTFRLHQPAPGIWQIDQLAAGEVQPQYQFAPLPRQLAEFADMCRYHQTDPGSHFTRKMVISKPTPTGRVTLSSTELKWTGPDREAVTPIGSTAEFEAQLAEHFGIRRQPT